MAASDKQRKFNPWDQFPLKSTGSGYGRTLQAPVTPLRLSTTNNCQVDAAEVEDPQNTPEQELLVAVMERAVTDSRLPSVPRHVQRETRDWVASDDLTPWGFRWICLQLSLSECVVQRLRQQMLRNLEAQSVR